MIDAATMAVTFDERSRGTYRDGSGIPRAGAWPARGISECRNLGRNGYAVDSREAALPRSRRHR